jgi:DNA-binding MarR family transcriptional regulator
MKPERDEAPVSTATGSGTKPMGTSIVVRLLAAHNLLIGVLRDGFGPSLTLARFDLLAQLSREDGQTLAALSRKMLVTAGNLTGLVDRAERDGIVERRPDPSDRRLTRVVLTAKGHRTAASAIRRHAEIAARIVEGLEEQEQADLRRLLGRLRENLEGMEAPPREPEPPKKAMTTKTTKRR